MPDGVSTPEELREDRGSKGPGEWQGWSPGRQAVVVPSGKSLVVLPLDGLAEGQKRTAKEPRCGKRHLCGVCGAPKDGILMTICSGVINGLRVGT